MHIGSCAPAVGQSELTLLSPNPITEPLTKPVEQFQDKAGIAVKVTFGTGVSTRKTVADGQALDVSPLFAPFPDALKTGNIVPSSATVVARMRLAVGAKKGAPKPDISTLAAARKALLDAKSIMAIVAKGEAEIALGPYVSEMRNPGVERQLRSRWTA